MSGEPSCIHMEVCRFPCIENCDYYHSYQSERDKVLSLIRCFIEHEGFNCREADAIKEYMEELRHQAGEP
jgi:predicted nucleic-acid-binding protein